MTDEHRDQHLESILRLAFVAEFRDADSSQHLRRISLLSGLLARQLGWSDAQAAIIGHAAPMHDIGKVAIPDEILLKPGRLSEDEREMMEQHTSLGSRLLGEPETPVLEMGEAICRTHHERWDGSGYPNRLAGEEIPLPGRIVGLVDVFDALVTRRVYKPAMSPAAAYDILREESGKHFDPFVVNAFFAVQDEVEAIYREYTDEDEDAEWVT